MEGTLKKRSDVKAFYGIPASGSGTPVYTRMRGFTEMSTSKNAKEYSRQYVDEAFETTDTVGYSTSISFAFDKYVGNAVLEDIAAIFDDELIGAEAQREIIQVDFTKSEDSGFSAVKRTFSVIADSTGDSTDAMTYSGTFKVVTGIEKGIATIATPDGGDSDTVETITFAASAE